MLKSPNDKRKPDRVEFIFLVALLETLMMDLPKLVLKKNEERRLRAGHLWIFSNEVDSQKTDLKSIEPGALVTVMDWRGKALGLAFFSRGSLICARLLTRDLNIRIDRSWFAKRIARALSLREQLFDKPYYRLVYAESDGLPGLVIDRFGDVCVVQSNTQGMDKALNMIVGALEMVISPRTIVIRNDSKARDYEQLPDVVMQFGQPVEDKVLIEENGVKFFVDPLKGQKTGWFFDHRENREWVSRYAKGRRVLDLFSYTGSFSVQAAVGGAAEVLAIDASREALDYLLENASLNRAADRVQIQHGDAFKTLKALISAGASFDVIVVDPPAFVPRKKDLKVGMEAYQRLNQLAVQLLKPGGLILSASCSMHLSGDSLQNIIRKALLRTGRTGQIIRQATQAPDHPIHPAIPESRYLKGYGFRVLNNE